jgi:hypothetical protein
LPLLSARRTPPPGRIGFAEGLIDAHVGPWSIAGRLRILPLASTGTVVVGVNALGCEHVGFAIG